MSGDWIKMRSDLFTHPKVVRISSALKADTLRTVGGLMSAWCLFDAHSVDGVLEGYTAQALDDHLRWPGFAREMVLVSWLVDCGESLELPRFDTHNGQSAKRRAQDSERKRNVRKTSASEADKSRTREEKRREEKEIPPAVPADAPTKAKKPRSEKTFTAWVQSLADGEMAIPEDDPVFASAEKLKLPDDFVELEWEWFRRKYGTGAKRYADWRKVFRNAVDGAWGNLWRIGDDGNYFLTTAGHQLRRSMDGQGDSV